VTVWRGEGDDGPMERVLSTTSAPTMTPASMWFISGANAAFAYDDIEIVADGWTSGTTFAVNSGNELTSSTFGGVTTTYGYDAWGNMTGKARGSYSAGYAWHYGGKLTGVTSTFPGEGAVTYAYGGDGKRRERTAGGVTTGYNYDLGWNLLNEEDGTGALTTTFIHAPQGAVGPMLADVAGGNPASGAYRYYALDHLGSTIGLYDGAKARTSALAYTPYGAAYGDVGPAPLPRYTGHLWDGAAGLHLAPYRAYAPTLARWLSRDPLGMVDGPNVYGYVRQSPVNRVDPTGKVSLCAVIMAVIYMTLLASKPINDKHKHCMVTCEIADSCGHADADLVGEYMSYLTKS
jgi:Rhs family protein